MENLDVATSSEIERTISLCAPEKNIEKISGKVRVGDKVTIIGTGFVTGISAYGPPNERKQIEYRFELGKIKVQGGGMGPSKDNYDLDESDMEDMDVAEMEKILPKVSK